MFEGLSILWMLHDVTAALKISGGGGGGLEGTLDLQSSKAAL